MHNKVLECPSCNGTMTDLGRIYDYYGDYSPYMDIDLMKLVDGDPNSSLKNECVHLFQCSRCRADIQLNIDTSNQC
ncbi:hypothetical protein ACQKCU_21550 [Heyndrickxia sporothermodurans]